MNQLSSILCLIALLAMTGCDASAGADEADAAPATQPATQATVPSADAQGQPMIDKIVKTEDEWRQILTPAQFHILREKGTERAFTGTYWDNHDHGVYKCAACDLDLFSSDTKFESGTGWPSFYAPIDPTHVSTEADRTHGMVRTEVICARCEGHLGHVFEDGPKPTGLRYCLNSAALEFEKK